MSLWTRPKNRGFALLPLGWIAVIAAGSAGAIGGCGDTPESTASSASTSSSSGGPGGGSSSSSVSSSTSSSSSSGMGGGMLCSAATGPTRGSAIAVTPDDSRLVAVNRDAGSVTVMSIDYGDGQPKMTNVAEIMVGGEPWQVVIDGCGKSAYVALRKDQQVVKIDNLDTNPTKGATVDVGSEPTSLALTPNNTKLYVASWVEGTLSVIDPVKMTPMGTVDLNPTIVATGALGAVTARPALAHPREIAITNNGDANDDDETVYATEWFALRTGPESAVGTQSDTNWQGLVYKVKVSDGSVDKVTLPSVANTGFKDSKAQDTGCFPNQVGPITIEGGFAYVSSICASPVGPLGVFQKNTCTSNANCASVGVGSVCVAGACTLSCAADADCGFGSPAGTCTLPAGTCKPINTNVKTTTHPAVSIIDLAAGKATTTVVDKLFDVKMSARVPHLATGLSFFNGFGYLSAMGTDAVFRLIITNGAITDVGSPANPFINLRKDSNDKVIRLPIGIATAHDKMRPFAFVDNDGDREVTALSLSAQAIAGDFMKNDFRITQSSALPVAGSPEESVLRGKRFFNTGLGRWSLNGAGWGSCATCHVDGLSDNVTWYFARGPRQTVSLDGSFASKDPTDQRILNWTGIFDEVADFESNTRGISGGVGAIVSANSSPPTNADRINTGAEVPQQQGLQGSSTDTANPMGMQMHAHSVIGDWLDIEAWVKTIRSPRKPRGLVQADVDAGKAIFSGIGSCVGCHSGAKWTISKLFYKPGDTPNAATNDPAATSLSNVSWNVTLNGFPQALFPADPASPTFSTDARMRFGAPPGAEQIQCVLRPVGTIGPIMGGVPQGVSDPAINVLELRQDMVTGGQGAAASGRGFNPPSLLGLQVGGPYFHAGNARTLEEVFSNLFIKHHQSAIANVFNPDATQIKQLVAYLLSIDELEPTFSIPAKGNQGGDLCFYP